MNIMPSKETISRFSILRFFTRIVPTIAVAFVAITAAISTAPTARAQQNSVAAGYYHSLYITTTGDLYAMGKNSSGQLGDGTTIDKTTPVKIASNVVSVAAGISHSLYVTATGDLYAMGNNGYGQLGDGTNTDRSTPVKVDSNVVSVAAGGNHSLYVTATGDLYSMGENSSGQLGDGTTARRVTPVEVATNVVSVAAGGWHSLYITASGDLYAMGYNSYGQLGDGTTTARVTPVKVASRVASVAANSSHSLYITATGDLYAMGENGYGQLGDGTTVRRTMPVKVASEISSVAAGVAHSLYVTVSKDLYSMGLNWHGSLGVGITTGKTTPVKVDSNVVAVAAGNHSLYVTATGNLYAMGDNDYGQLGDGRTTNRITPTKVATTTVFVAAGGSHSLYFTDVGVLYAMGHNGFGQLGSGTTTERTTPMQVATNVTSVTAGEYHSLYITSIGDLYAMGRNDYGQLGDETKTNRSTPVKVGIDVVAATSGSWHSLYITATGDLYGMGDNSYSQLGDGTTTNRETPVKVASNVISVAAGDQHSLYVMASGDLYAIGGNSDGQLGDGTTIDRRTPVKVASGVVSVAARDRHSLYITASGDLYAMGLNDYGQLGDGINSRKTTPVKIASNVASAVAGGSHNLYLTTSGDLYAIGNNEYGQLGDETTTNRTIPVKVASNIASLAAGDTHSLYVTTSGDLYVMGDNEYGQLGDGKNNTLPKKIAGSILIPRSDVAISSDDGMLIFAPNHPFTLQAHLQKATSFPLAYQWYKDGIAITEATGQMLESSLSTGSAVFSVEIIVNGTIYRSEGTTIEVALTITQQPQNVSVNTGETATFNVAIAGSGTLSYQWYKDGVEISGATSSLLTVPTAQAVNAGTYTVVVTNASTSVTSTPATLTVNDDTPPPAPKYALTVTGGTGAGEFAEGTSVTITANAAPEGKVFSHWKTSSGSFDSIFTSHDSDTNATLSFGMPGKDKTITAVYRTLALLTQPAIEGTWHFNGAESTVGENETPSSTLVSASQITVTKQSDGSYKFDFAWNNTHRTSTFTVENVLLEDETSLIFKESKISDIADGSKRVNRVLLKQVNTSTLLLTIIDSDVRVGGGEAEIQGAIVNGTALAGVLTKSPLAQIETSHFTGIHEGREVENSLDVVSPYGAWLYFAEEGSKDKFSYDEGLVIEELSNWYNDIGGSIQDVQDENVLGYGRDYFDSGDERRGEEGGEEKIALIREGIFLKADFGSEDQMDFSYLFRLADGKLGRFALSGEGKSERGYSGFEASAYLDLAASTPVTPPGENPPVAKYALTVNGGTGTGELAEGATITITANAAPAGKVFSNWTTSNGGTFANVAAATTTFTMPAAATTITANYVDATPEIGTPKLDIESLPEGALVGKTEAENILDEIYAAIGGVIEDELQIRAGSSITLGVEENPAWSYQWQKFDPAVNNGAGGWINVGDNAATYTEVAIAKGDRFRVVVTNEEGVTAESPEIRLTNVVGPPEIKEKNWNDAENTRLSANGGKVTLSVKVEGTGRIYYQWFKKNAATGDWEVPPALKNAVGPSVLISEPGAYRVAIADRVGVAVYSEEAVVTE